jgi:type I restriction enzyme M protein
MQYDIVLSNFSFGDKEVSEAQSCHAYKTSALQDLFLQHILDSLAPNDSCGMVLDEGILFRTSDSAFVPTKSMFRN